jgi:galactokinase
VIFRAPGRVNLIGDHTDYNGGFALPIAIDLECVVTSTPRDDGELHVEGDDRYAPAVASALGVDVGIDATIASTIPIGSGLSSSAALEVALALALLDAAGVARSREEIARACRDAEYAATGVPCGVMDQLASLGGRAGCALLMDCRSLEVTPIELREELALIVVHSGLPRTLAGSAYAERRAACERAARDLGVTSLRDATAAQVADNPRARHVVSESARVLAAVDALRVGDLEELGRLLLESHASLRDDFEVSTPELDTLVDALVRSGASGARLTGAGFGGCVVAIARREDAREIAERAAATYERASGRQPTVYLPKAVDGAGRI